MNRVKYCLLCALLALPLAACKSSHSKTAPTAGPSPEAAGQLQQLQYTSILVRGEVRNPIVPWAEGMGLSEVMVAADYVGRWTPMAIYIIRRGKSHYVSPRQLMSGASDPLMEPGDVVEIRR